MPVNTSIYQAQQPVQAPDVGAMAQRALTLSNLGMQNQQQQINMQTQQAMREAYAANTNPDGSINRTGMLSAIGRVNPQAAMEMSKQFNAMDMAQAQKNAAQADAAEKTLTVTGPAFEYLAKLPEDQRAQAYGGVMKQLSDQGIDVSRMKPTYDPNSFNQYYSTWRQSKPSLEAQVQQSTIAKNQAETALTPVKYKSEVFGSRSPTQAIQEDYNKDVKPIRESQIAMRQMMDNYNNPSPQGDASLKLNAFKIKFPTAPDVNSLEELSKAQGLSDQMKAYISHNLQGTLDPNTRANLMRDAISTYRANYGTYQDTAKRYEGMAQKRNIPLGGMTDEPELTKTFNDAMDFQKQIGPYVPPAERGGGIISGAGKLLSSLVGSAAPKSAVASEKAVPSSSDQAALDWLKNPKTDAASPEAFAVRAKLKRKGLL